MKKNIVWLVCSVAFVFGMTGNGLSEEIVTGVIIEQSGNKEFVQVEDAVYLVESVWLDDGEQAVIQTTVDSLNVGDVVQVYPGEKEVDFWHTERVVQLEGDRKGEVVEQFELELDVERTSKESSATSPSVSQPVDTDTPGQVILENGVWVN